MRAERSEWRRRDPLARPGIACIDLGILPGLGSTHLLPRLVGPAMARELVLSARVFRSEEAAGMGLVNRVVPAEDLEKEARELAAAMAECDPAVLAAAKRALLYGEGHGMQESMRNEERESALLRKGR